MMGILGRDYITYRQPEIDPYTRFIMNFYFSKCNGLLRCFSIVVVLIFACSDAYSQDPAPEVESNRVIRINQGRTSPGRNRSPGKVVPPRPIVRDRRPVSARVVSGKQTDSSLVAGKPIGRARRLPARITRGNPVIPEKVLVDVPKANARFLNAKPITQGKTSRARFSPARIMRRIVSVLSSDQDQAP